MSGRLEISRRDFLNGVAIGVAAGGLASPLDVLASAATPYPPRLTGLRGSHPGSFEVAHAVAWNGARFAPRKKILEAVYDLVVVGGGISGLAAAHFYRQRAGGNPRVLVLDNHDDFGGHAKRNEFVVDGKTLVGYGGSQSIDGPARFSAAARQLLVDAGIDTERFYDYYDRRFFDSRGLGRGIFFDKAHYGRNVLAPNVFRGWGGGTPDDLAGVIAAYPISGAGREALTRLLAGPDDPWPQLDRAAKIDFLRRIAYTDYLQAHLGVPAEATAILRDMILGLWGVGWDALSALEALRSGMPGLQALGIGDLEEPDTQREEPYIFHFPDGNAGVARALLRQLLPAAVPGKTMEDLVTARVDYDQLDRRGAPTRIRLASTVVDLRHTADQRHVDVTYVHAGETQTLRARHVVFAGYNAMLPPICGELPAAQREALSYAEKVPLVYHSIAVRNWRPLQALGFHNVHIPHSRYMYAFGLDFPVSMGDYRYATNPDEPTILHGSWVPHLPDSGLPARAQHAAGRRQLYELSFADFEADIVDKLSGALEPGGFDAERDIAAITVNRWPHGYAYEYNDLSDPVGFGPDNGPHVAGRAQLGRISIANSDASAYAYVNGAIDAADRAVREQMQVA